MNKIGSKVEKISYGAVPISVCVAGVSWCTLRSAWRLVFVFAVLKSAHFDEGNQYLLLDG